MCVFACGPPTREKIFATPLVLLNMSFFVSLSSIIYVHDEYGVTIMTCLPAEVDALYPKHLLKYLYFPFV